MKTITPKQLQERIAAKDGIVIIDVREASEVAQGMLPNALHIPLASLPSRASELQVDSMVTVYCHHGARSAQAVRFLEASGFKDAANLEGGIDAWSRDIDPSIPLY